MRRRDLKTRAGRLLYRLDLRLDVAAATATVDEMPLSAMADRYHTMAGWFEARILPFADECAPRVLAEHLRTLRTILASNGRLP